MVDGAVRVAPLPADAIEEALPLFAGYQRFYGAEPDDDRNRRFFPRFVDPSDEGLLLGAWLGDRLVGFACLYWTQSSIVARDIVYLADLFVAPDARGRGAGRVLLEACAEVSRRRGAHHLEWLTAVDNEVAQRVYDRISDVERSTWVGYEVPIADG
jgi:GNAT superfamily N-acetyltransferase